MTIKSVAIFGAGAVGSYCIYGLSKCDIQLSVIAKDERNERLKKNGCLINNIMYHPEVLTPKEAHGVDYCMFKIQCVARCFRRYSTNRR